jgi:Cathepsin propeptide inhibitor domain (I29)
MRTVLLVLVLALVSFTSCEKTPMNKLFSNYVESLTSTKDQFKLWHYMNNKSYNLNSEFSLERYRIFKQNLKKSEEHNSKNLGYTLGITRFADLTSEEFKAQYLTSDLKASLSKEVGSVKKDKKDKQLNQSTLI